jgi:hypothetical protein
MQIIPLYFAISLFISILVLYLLFPAPRVIIKEPNIKDDVSELYIDEKDTCYKYYKEEVSCKEEKK